MAASLNNFFNKRETFGKKMFENVQVGSQESFFQRAQVPGRDVMRSETNI